MKKTFIFALLMGVIASFCACDGCGKKEGNVEVGDSVAPFVVENIISTDKQAMFVNHGGDYRWFETMVLFNDFLDEETDGSIAEVVNVFQAVVGNDSCADVKVFKFQHLADGTFAADSVNGFWIEDLPIVDSLAIIPFDSAYTLIQQVNYPKPHSKHACLRTPLGPIPVNPQWVFGNTQSQLWVDAVTGEVKPTNPAFPDGFKMPLGEWP